MGLLALLGTTRFYLGHQNTIVSPVSQPCGVEIPHQPTDVGRSSEYHKNCIMKHLRDVFLQQDSKTIGSESGTDSSTKYCRNLDLGMKAEKRVNSRKRILPIEE